MGSSLISHYMYVHHTCTHIWPPSPQKGGNKSPRLPGYLVGLLP